LGQLLLLRLDVLQDCRELRLCLLTRLCDLGELLLGRLKRLLQGGELRLDLIAGLCCLSELLLSRLRGLLSGRELGLGLLTCAISVSQLLLSICNLGLEIRQCSRRALLLAELASRDLSSLQKAGCLSTGLLQPVRVGEPEAKGYKPAQDSGPS
jgi:hypothetical protein